ncbi:hypothetical protein K2O51_31150 (plasmid) [Cupriavidus pinatubonensis]|uniref:hypothetical protein n=1 Tax=Cupriavidus pinatubonensis TaxID=248026 RepID=UPI001C7320CE|nr:hypothetical protein [Cupriavidus pinatubonensis]QYY33704.1 hypothetical protein K2O51_31150 [Cupriavidus pinatubonensis]
METTCPQSEIEQLQAERKADLEWKKWRRRAARRLPELAARVFALKGKDYYATIGRLGRLISDVGDPTSTPYEGKQRFGNRIVTQIAFEALHAELREAEAAAKEIAARSGDAG